MALNDEVVLTEHNKEGEFENVNLFGLLFIQRGLKHKLQMTRQADKVALKGNSSGVMEHSGRSKFSKKNIDQRHLCQQLIEESEK